MKTVINLETKASNATAGGNHGHRSTHPQPPARAVLANASIDYLHSDDVFDGASKRHIDKSGRSIGLSSGTSAS
jgi:hypothetical protein